MTTVTGLHGFLIQIDLRDDPGPASQTGTLIPTPGHLHAY